MDTAFRLIKRWFFDIANKRKTLHVWLFTVWFYYMIQKLLIKTKIKQKGFPLVNILKASIKQIPIENPVPVTLRFIF